MFKLKYTLIILPLLLSACHINKNIDNATAEEQWQIHQQDLKQVVAFQVNGSIAHFSDKSRNYARFLILQQSEEMYEIKITTPLGGNIVSLKANSDYAELIDRDGRHYTDRDVESLMRKISNINIPLNSLHNWLKGFSDDTSNIKLDNSGRLASTEFMQNANKWNLTIPNYMTRKFKSRQIDLPATIELKHNDEKIRLKIDNWILR
ncbi:outer membrane lipoprotein LolB [Gilliamella sp. ESL0441]|uniref:lipoprotein insertase outer membrane protein LolB n=1 Tax=Gilliamella sp. ESL0441 TaxID=2704654 RepID=UPI001C69AC9C|nr:lipoprotein insertase outer membrane protein LolB [Gilliamella sp. ESL0441]QYN44448.1 outer membrane lipoprotein LolB [Gilliamella sp. ESL0441]